MRSCLKHFGENTGIRTTFTARADVDNLDTTSRTVLYRIAQEALTNVARHSKATKVRVTIRLGNDDICLEVRDDGCGFDVDDAPNSPQSRRLGLLGMRERAEIIGGTLSITSAPGKPTIVRVLIPKPQSNDKL
jgi:signal transduction histidine kinase